MKNKETLKTKRSIHRNRVYNCQKLETTQVPSAVEWINKLWFISTAECSSAIKKEQTVDRCGGILTLCRCKTPLRKCLLYEFMKDLKQVKPICCQKTGLWGMMMGLWKEHEGHFLSMVLFCFWIWGWFHGYSLLLLQYYCTLKIHAVLEGM